MKPTEIETGIGTESGTRNWYSLQQRVDFADIGKGNTPEPLSFPMASPKLKCQCVCWLDGMVGSQVCCLVDGRRGIPPRFAPKGCGVLKSHHRGGWLALQIDISAIASRRGIYNQD